MKKLLTEWRKYIKEVEKIADIATDQSEIQKSLDYFYKEHAPSKAKRQDLGDFKGHQIALFTGGEFGKDELMFVVDKDDRPIAYVATNPHEDAYAIGNVRKVKGGGFYITDLYNFLVDRYGTLYSDSKQTTAGESIWKRLQRDPALKVEEPSKETGNRWRATKGGGIKEEWSSAERKKRKDKCSNPKGFTMKQFCKNQSSRSKKGERKN